MNNLLIQKMGNHWIILGVISAVLIGLALGASAYPLLAVLVALFVVPAVLAIPLEATVIALILVTFCIQGSLNYFFGFSKALWFPYLLSGLIISRIIFEKKPKNTPEIFELIKQPMIVLLLTYLLVAILATLMSENAAATSVAGWKTLLPFWLVVPAMWCLLHKSKFRDWFWRILLLTACIQLPFVAYQHFVIVPSRGGYSAWDSVVGTFGGNKDGGGANSTLVIFVIWMCTYTAALYQNKLVTGLKFLTIALLTIAVIFLGEVKASFIWLPLALALVMRKTLFRRLSVFLVYLCLSIVVMFATFKVYDALYWSEHSKSETAGDRIANMQYFFDTAGMDYKTGEVSRGASLGLWFNDPNIESHQMLIGHGPASWKISATTGLGEIAKRYYPLSIGATTLAVLLWDVGVIGALLFVAILIALFQQSRHLSNTVPDKLEQARLNSIFAISVILITNLFYNRYLVDEPSTQLILALCVAYCCYQKIRYRVVQ
jgi:hypothetical protein